MHPRHLPHVPLLRAGRPHRSLDVAVLRHAATGEPVAAVSQAQPGAIARDLAAAGAHRRALQEVPVVELVAIAARAAELFLTAELPLDEGQDGGQTPEDYLRQLAATAGLPASLGRLNMAKIGTVLAEMATLVAGLTRGLDAEALDRGWTVEGEGGAARPVSYRRETDVLGVVLPSNSPGVHGLWIPAIALKLPVALKPGAREPWTPWRVAQALIAAGCPRAALSFYPGDHAAATEILLRAGRSMLFGDRDTVASWADDPRVQVHGPGWSKVIVGPDRVDLGGGGGWRRHLDLMVTSVAANGGRSCVNASGVWAATSPATVGRGRGVPRGEAAAAIAEALAERLAAVEARALDDPRAELAAFPDPAVARRLSAWLDRQLAVPGVEDVTARYRRHGTEGRLVEVDGLTFLLPTVVRCDDPGHPLARTELLFPFVSVVEVATGVLAERLEESGPTLVATALTDDPRLVRTLVDHPRIERLNLAPVPTCNVVWDQPHEGDLFAHLYRRRALQAPAPPPASPAPAAGGPPP